MPRKKKDAIEDVVDLGSVSEVVKDMSILTIDSGSQVETNESIRDLIWHEIMNAYRTRKPLTGVLGGVEKSEAGSGIAVVYYKEFRVVIPFDEMVMLSVLNNGASDISDRQSKVIGNMLGAEIDFIIKGVDSESKSVVASRRDAMYRKRQIFYQPDAAGNVQISSGRVVQSRVIAVSGKTIRVEVFGVECSIPARDLSWDWMGDAAEKYHIGDQVLVRVQEVSMDSIEDIRIKCDVKTVVDNDVKERLKACKVQGEICWGHY